MEIKLVYIGIGGFLGAVMRYLVSGWAYQLLGTDFPYGTLVVNIIGALLLGFFMSLSLHASILVALRSSITIGFLGAFTTFSTFSYETLLLFQQGEFWRGLFNVGISVLLGLLAVWVGMLLARLLI